MLSIEGDLRRIDHRCVSSKWDSYNRSAPSEMILSLNIFINEAQASDVQELVHKLKVLSHICASLSLSLQLASERKHWHAAPKRPDPPNYSREVRNPPPSPSPAGLSVESSATAGGPLAPLSPDHHPSPSRTHSLPPLLL